MTKKKRVTLFAGHYGSGKTNIAVNYALALKRQGLPVLIADLDVVNPYFRTKDSADELRAAGIDVLCSPYANTNLDAPALPEEMYRICRDRDTYAVVDVGGDDQGAVALGRYTPGILEENDFDMLFVANAFRPLTRTPEEALGVMREIEAAGGIPFTGIINNSNLAEETSADDVLRGEEFCRELSRLCDLPHVMTCAEESLCDTLDARVEHLFPLRLQRKYYL